MENSKDREYEFEKELKALLKKYDAEIEIVDNGIAHHEDKIMQVSISTDFRQDGKCLAEYTEINLGTNFDGK